MTIDAAGFFDWAVRDPGPADRWAYFGRRHTDMTVLCHHSLEGYFRPVGSLGYNVMKDPQRFPTAWHGTVTRFELVYQGHTYPPGTLFQHYPITYWLQHGHAANSLGPGFEAEGFTAPYSTIPPEDCGPLSPEQVATYRRMHADMAEAGYAFTRNKGSMLGLVEHREMSNGQTACPHERYAPLWAAPQEEDALKLTEVQTENLLLRLFAGKEFVGTETREQRLARALAELDKTDTVQSVSDTALSAIVVAQTAGAGFGPLPAGTTFTATVVP